MPRRAEGTSTIRFICKDSVPADRLRTITYARIYCTYQLQKEEVNRTRITARGDRIHCPFDCRTPTTDLITVKMLTNSIISTPHAKWMTLDIKKIYLNTPTKRKEYMHMDLSNFTEDVLDHYNLKYLAGPNGKIHVEISKGMYGLLIAGRISQDPLEEHLASFWSPEPR